jgi:hypothetical protein
MPAPVAGIQGGHDAVALDRRDKPGDDMKGRIEACDIAPIATTIAAGLSPARDYRFSPWT